jgi:hypothetical protein
MQKEFDRSLFASVLVALAVLLSMTSAARFPSALQHARSAAVGGPAVSVGAPEGRLTSLR